MGLIAAAGIAAAGTIGASLLSKGSKPNVPGFTPIDFAKEQSDAIKQNITSLKPASELAQKTTAADQSVLEEQLRRAIPGYDKLIAQAGSNIGASLRGEISPEVSAQVQRSTAGRALSGGFGGASGMGRSLTARDLGLTGMQIQNQGLQQAQSFIQQQRAYGMVQPFSTSSMFITPAQRVGVLQQQQQAQYGRDLTAAQVAAMPDPTMSAIGSGISAGAGLYGGALMQKSLYGNYNPNPYGQSSPYVATNFGSSGGYANSVGMSYSPGLNTSSSGSLYSNPINYNSGGYGDIGMKYN